MEGNQKQLERMQRETLEKLRVSLEEKADVERKKYEKTLEQRNNEIERLKKEGINVQNKRNELTRLTREFNNNWKYRKAQEVINTVKKTFDTVNRVASSCSIC